MERAERNMKREITGITICSVLLALCFPAEAQQPKKILRIGFLAAPLVPLTRLRAKHSGKVCVSLDTWRRKTSSLSGDYAEGKVDRLPEFAAELVRLKVDLIVTVVLEHVPAKEATATIPIVMIAGRDPVIRVRRQSGAAWRKHYWLCNPSPRS